MYRIDIHRPDYDIVAIEDALMPEVTVTSENVEGWKREIDRFADSLDSLSAKARTLSVLLAQTRGEEPGRMALRTMKSDLFAIHDALQKVLGLAGALESRVAGPHQH